MRVVVKVVSRSCVRIPTSDNLTLLSIRLNLQKFKKMMTFSIQIYYTSFYSTIIIIADYHFGKSTLVNYNRPIGYENGKSCFFENGTIGH